MDFNNMNNGMPSFPTMNGEVQTRVEEPSNKGKLIVADDAPVIRTIIKSSVPDFDVIEASNGDEANQKLAENPDIDGMFLDLMMPGSDGFTVLNNVKNNNIFVPITVISGDDSATTVQRVFDEYKDVAYIDYVNKPINREKAHEKAARMQQITRSHKLQNTQQQSSVANFNDYQQQEEQSYQRVA